MRALSRTHRTYVVAAGVASIVTAANASQGAYFSQSWGWVALAFLVPTTVLLILDRVTRPGRLRTAFAMLMGALAVWIALSSLWSISSAASIREAERALVYVAVALAVTLVLRRGDAAGVFAGLLVGAALVVSYGLATRLFPDRFGFADDPFNLYRLAEPLGYWNSLGLLAAIGVILALGALVHGRKAVVASLGASLLPVFGTALYFTFSRGSWIALAFGLAVTLVLDPRRLRLLWSLAVVSPPSILAVLLAARQKALTTEGSSAVEAALEGHRLAWVLAGLVLASAGLGLAARRTSLHLPLSGTARRGGDIALAAITLLVASVSVIALGGPSTVLTDLRDRFESDPPATLGPDLNERLFSVSGNGRAELLAIAWDVGRGDPLRGSGAGTFEYILYERRPRLLIVRDAHSLYAEMFMEVGLVGLALLCAVMFVPLIAAVRSRRVRGVAPAAGAYVAWLAAAGLDWHWEMVGLTLVALLACGVALLASEGPNPARVGVRTRGTLIGLTTLLSLVATWSLVGNQALFAAREAVARNDWVEARDHGRRAEALLGWSHEPKLVIAAAAAGAGDRQGAILAARAAVDQNPRSWIAWLQLARVTRGAERAAAYDHVRDLNPRFEGGEGE